MSMYSLFPVSIQMPVLGLGPNYPSYLMSYSILMLNLGMQFCLTAVMIILRLLTMAPAIALLWMQQGKIVLHLVKIRLETVVILCVPPLAIAAALGSRRIRLAAARQCPRDCLRDPTGFVTAFRCASVRPGRIFCAYVDATRLYATDVPASDGSDRGGARSIAAVYLCVAGGIFVAWIRKDQ